MLLRARRCHVRLCRVSNYAIASQANPAHGRNQASAPVSEAVPISSERRLGVGQQEIGLYHVRGARVVDVDHEDHGRTLSTIEDQFIAELNQHG